MAHWNLCRFAETLIPLIDENQDIAIEKAQEAISNYTNLYNRYWLKVMRSKLGIFNEEDNDQQLIENLLSIMNKYKADFTNTFVALTLNKQDNNEMFNSEEYKSWYKLYQDRLKRQDNSTEEVNNLMKSSNPYVIPRNHRVEEALEASERGDFTIFNNLLKVLKNPYEYSKEQEEYSKLPKRKNTCYRTYCGT